MNEKPPRSGVFFGVFMNNAMRVMSLPILLAVVAVVLYGQVLTFGYVWDDSLLFLDKSGLLNDRLSWKLLSEPVLPGTTYLRPLIFLTLYIEFQISEQNSMLSHAVNLAIFTMNVQLLYFIASLGLNRRPAIAFVVSLIYVVHPANIETVAWVSGRFDLLVTTFILGAVLLFLQRSVLSLRVCYMLIGLAYIFALMSKELGIVLPFILALLAYGFSGKSGAEGIKFALRNHAGLWCVLAVITAGYFVLRIMTFESVYHSAFSAQYIHVGWFEKLLPLEALKFYMGQALLPFSTVSPVHPIESYRAIGVSQYFTLLFAPVILLLSLVVLWKRGGLGPSLFFCGVACLGPVLHLIPITILDNIGHERFLCTALAFFVLSAAYLPIVKMLSWLSVPVHGQVRIIGLAVAGWSFMAVLTVLSALPLWRSDFTLWSWAHSKHPENTYARYNYLYGAIKQGHFHLAEEELTALRQDDGGLDVGEQILYAHLLLRQGDEEAISYLEGVFYALPDFHNMSAGRYSVDRFALTRMQIAGAYISYSSALVIFKADLKGALKYNEIARWYLDQSEMLPALYQRAAILELSGDHKEAAELIRKIESVRAYNIDEIRAGYEGLKRGFCEHHQKPVPCTVAG